jgi:hypothetical protein
MNIQNEGPSVVSAADFARCDLEAPIASLDQIDMTAISSAYHNAAMGAATPCDRVYGFLRDISGIYLSAERERIWGPRLAYADRRSMIPSDIRGEQSDILEAILPSLVHPALRARIADIVWTNDMRKAAIAAVAVEAYFGCVEGLMKGSLKAAHPVDGRDLIDAVKPAQRALQIARQTTKSRRPLPARVVSVMEALYDNALSDGQPVIFSRIAQLCVDNKIVEPQKAAGDLERVVEADPKIYPIALRGALDFASILYRNMADSEGEQRCYFAAVLQTLRMRDECGDAGGKASWVMEALQRLHHIRSENARALEEQLEGELRRLRRASLLAMESFSFNVDIPQERERIIELFSQMDFSTALKNFALLASSPKMEDLKAEALREAQANPLS